MDTLESVNKGEVQTSFFHLPKPFATLDRVILWVPYSVKLKRLHHRCLSGDNLGTHSYHLLHGATPFSGGTQFLGLGITSSNTPLTVSTFGSDTPAAVDFIWLESDSIVGVPNHTLLTFEWVAP